MPSALRGRWGLPPGFQTATEFRLVAAVDRLVVAALLWQVTLRGMAAGEVVTVLIALTMAELGSAAVMRVTQVQRDGQRPPRAHVLAGFLDGQRGGVGLRRRGDVRYGLG